MAASRRRDIVLASVGAVAILLAAVTLALVQERAGPYAADLRPAPAPVASDGLFEASPQQDSQLPGGICDDSLPGGECQDAVTRLDWRLDGLPDPGVGAAYHAALVAGDDVRIVGALLADGDGHRIQRDEARFDADVNALRLVLGAGGDGVALLEIPIQATGRTSLTQQTEATLPGAGTVRIERIGAAETSLLAQLSADEAPDGFTVRAWLIGDDVVHLVDLSAGTGDVRIERLAAGSGDRIELRLVAPDAAVGERPEGFLWMAGTLR